MKICFRVSSEVKTRVSRIEATKAPIIFLLLDLELEKILEAGYLGLMVFTKALLRRSQFWKRNPKVGYEEYGLDFSITVRKSEKGLIDHSN